MSIIALSKNKSLSYPLIALFSILFLIDFTIFMRVKKVAMILSGSLLYILIFLILYWRLQLSVTTNNLIIGLVTLIIIITGFIINEAVNCKRMMEKWRFPYHIIIELLGVAMFSLMAYIYCLIESEI